VVLISPYAGQQWSMQLFEIPSVFSKPIILINENSIQGVSKRLGRTYTMCSGGLEDERRSYECRSANDF
jgi:hypothetical protein